MEDEIIFKNQELQEFVAGIKTRDEKIQMMENIWFRSQRNAPSEVEISQSALIKSYSGFYNSYSEWSRGNVERSGRGPNRLQQKSQWSSKNAGI